MVLTTIVRNETRRRVSPRRGGYSLVEALVALLIFQFIALAILPLMLRGVTNNRRGGEALEVSRELQSKVETLRQLPYDAGDMVLADGSPAGVENEIWVHRPDALPQAGWEAGTFGDYVGGDGVVIWTRETRIEQFNIADLEPDSTGLVRLESPIEGGSRGFNVHLKQIEGTVRGTRIAGPLGAGQELTVRFIRSY